MSALALYLIKVLAYSGIFAGYYQLFMRKESFIRWNRWYLLAATFLSVLLPLVKLTIVSYYEPVPIADEPLDEVFPYIATGGVSYAALVGWLLALLYALVALLLTAVGVRGLIQISRLKKASTCSYLNAVRLYCCKQKIAPFSFFKSVFMPDTIPLGSSEGQQVLRHELEHVRAYHSADKVLVQLACMVFWFNPFFWFFRREQSMVHEFLADRACVRSGETQELSRLILCTLYPVQHVYFGNQFFQSPIKRRLAMIAKNKTTHSSWRKLLILPVALACLCVFAVSVESKPIPKPMPEPVLVDEPQPDPEPQPPQKASANNDGSYLYQAVEVKPLFEGASAEGFSKWVSSQIVYPKEAMDKKLQGRVILSFLIAGNGKLTDIEVLRGVHPLLDNEAKRVIELSPAWTPGKQNGKAVPVRYTFPVSFTLMDDDEPKAASSASDSNQSKPNDDGSYPYETVEVKPLFQGTNVHGFSRWVASRIVYPAAAQKNGIQGKVILSFLIASDGKVTDIKVLSSAHPLLDNEAKRLVALSPAWTPGQQNGKAVPVNYTFPVNFTLTEDDDESAKAEDRNEGL